jgi:hypothetical protein
MFFPTNEQMNLNNQQKEKVCIEESICSLELKKEKSFFHNYDVENPFHWCQTSKTEFTHETTNSVSLKNKIDWHTERIVKYGQERLSFEWGECRWNVQYLFQTNNL